MSNKFYLVKYYYDNKLWTEERVHKAAEKEWITYLELAEILK